MRIAYAVMGYGRGHAMRTAAVLPALYPLAVLALSLVTLGLVPLAAAPRPIGTGPFPH